MKPLYAILFCLCSLVGLGQKHDYVWLSGYSSSAGLDTFTNKMFGISRLDFNADTLTVSYDSLDANFFVTNCSFSDGSGNLLFSSNGVKVRNGLDELIENGDSLNVGYVTANLHTSAIYMGYQLPQGILALEDPAHVNCYYLVHSFLDSTEVTGEIVTRKILYTYIDMNANGGRGKILYKNREMLYGRFGAELQAVRHGNGRDWWIIVQRRHSGCYAKILLNDEGIGYHSEDCFSNIITKREGAACFSPDGSQYAYLAREKGLSLFEFDRCAGKLSNMSYFPMPIFLDSGLIAIGTAFSLSGRFLYVNATTYSYQFDLHAGVLGASIDTVAVYDGTRKPMATWFHTMQLGPDGKIYSSTGNAEYAYHVIENPDMKGAECGFVQHGVDLPSYAGASIPNYPNYRLGALPGSACDTLTSVKDIAEKEKILNVFPNPTSDIVTVDYGYTDWSKGGVVLEISNALGQTVHRQDLPMYSGYQKMDVSNYSSGSYTLFIKRNGNIVATGRLVKE